MQPTRPTLFFVSVTTDVTLKLADHAGEYEVVSAILGTLLDRILK